MRERTGGQVTPDNARFFDSPAGFLPPPACWLPCAQGTIVVVTIPWIVLVGPVDELTRALLIGASWVLSLAVAEYFIYRRAHGPVRKPRPSVPTA